MIPKRLKFAIYGNQENTDGNPIPYVRSTRGSLWRPNSMRYAGWKHYVAIALIGSTPATAAKEMNAMMWRRKKPILLDKDQKAEMKIKIFWKDKTHGDPDNVWKGIADAIFVNDKNVSGSFSGAVSSTGRGRVEVTIKEIL